MTSANRSVAKVTEYYRAGVSQFISARLAPPVDFVSSGKVSIPEAMPVLLDLHAEVAHRVASDTTRVLPKAVRKVGEAVVVDAMRAKLARIYGIGVGDLDKAQAMYKQTNILAPDQPRANGDYDFDLLRAECQELLCTHTGADRPPFALGYATVGDPRLARRLALVSSVPGRLIWASMPRPHEIDELRYEDLRIIWYSSGRWLFDFRDWRRRAFAAEEHAEWDALMDSVRKQSAEAGLTWKANYEGKRA